MELFQAIWIAIVEGLTEFLPVSSTAHMIFTEKFLGVASTDFSKLFTYSIQFGAILSVVVLYWRKFFDIKNLQFYIKLAVAIIPALVLGKLFSEKIDAVLEKPQFIAFTLVLGGIVLLFIDKAFAHPTVLDEKKISIKKSFIIGLYQCLAMMPGVSRSAASIVGGMQQKLSRSAAAEFSFFLAVPTMLAVIVYAVFLKKWGAVGVEQKGYEILLSSKENIMLFVIGNLVAFVVAVVAIKFFIAFVKKYGFKIWGVYRIIVGLFILLLIYKGVI